MSTAIFIITFVAFIGRIVISAIALRNWLTASALSILAVAVYAAPAIAGFSLEHQAGRLHSSLGTTFVLLLCAVMFAIGYGVPTLLAYAERNRRWMRLAFLSAVVVTILAADLWRMELVLGLVRPYIIPETWFTAGTACFLIFKARIFEDSDDAPQLNKQRL